MTVLVCFTQIKPTFLTLYVYTFAYIRSGKSVLNKSRHYNQTEMFVLKRLGFISSKIEELRDDVSAHITYKLIII